MSKLDYGMSAVMPFANFRQGARRSFVATALLLGLAAPATAQYIGGNPPPLPPAPLPGVIETPAASLARSIRILAANPRDFPALMAAGRDELELGDLEAAVGFFGRAEEQRPSDPAPKVGMGGALVLTGDARGALGWFARAEALGASPALLGADRGLAHDLLGEQATAQRDYRSALAGPTPDEARRRLALSLAIGGYMGEGISTLQPLLQRRDPAAQRVRAFVLALGGQKAAAVNAIEQSMPGASTRIGPFFDLLPRLNATQKAAAVHLGVFPTATDMALISAAPMPVIERQPEPARPARPGFFAKQSPRPSNPLPSETATSPRRPALSAPQMASAQADRVAPPPPRPRPRYEYVEDESLRPIASIGGFSSKRHRVRVIAEPVASMTSNHPVTAARLVPDTDPPAEPLREPEPARPPSRVSDIPVPADVATASADRLSGIDHILASTGEPLRNESGNVLPDPGGDVGESDDRASTKSAKSRVMTRKAAAAPANAKMATPTEKAATARIGTTGDYWVQLAGGTNSDRMAQEFMRIRAKKPALFAGHPGYVSAGKEYFRLLVGPFDDGEASRAFATKLANAGIDAFSWARNPPQIKIEKLPSK